MKSTKKTMKWLFQEIVIFIVQGKNYSSVTRKVKSYVFVCYAICSLFYSAISDWSIVWGTECKNLSTMILKNLGFSTLECLYFICFEHSYFISIDMDIPQMKSNYGFCEKKL